MCAAATAENPAVRMDLRRVEMIVVSIGRIRPLTKPLARHSSRLHRHPTFGNTGTAWHYAK